MYSVKYGQWCQKDGKRWWTGTKEDLMLAKQAGQVNDSDRVIVRERTRALGEITMSVLPMLPGFLLCDGRQFDKEIFKDLYEALGDDHTPDMREAAPAGAGERTGGVAEHDVFAPGEFKDDCVQRHFHSRGTMEITGKTSVLTYTGESEGALSFERAGENYVHRSFDKSPAGYVKLQASKSWTGKTSAPENTAISYQEVINPIGDPSANGWYEFSIMYVTTSDVYIDYSKAYYYASTYAKVDLLGLANPKNNGWYERDESFDEAVFIKSNDTRLVNGKPYYRHTPVHPAPDPSDPSINPDDDIAADNPATYFVIDLTRLADPKAENWQEAKNSEYRLTTDIVVQLGKAYYEKIESNVPIRIGDTTRGKRVGMNFFIAY